MQRDLVEAARRGDHEAFEVLASTAGDRLYATARLILRSSDLAEDAVQEALIRAWRQLPSLRDPDRFDAWLYRLSSTRARTRVASRGDGPSASGSSRSTPRSVTIPRRSPTGTNWSGASIG